MQYTVKPCTKSSGISLVGHHHSVDIQVTPDRTVTLVIVPVELSTSIYVIHTATYIVNTYVPQINFYLRSKRIKYVFTCNYDRVTSNEVDNLQD